MNKPEPLSTRERVARRRAALRAQGLRPKQVWVPDLRSPEMRERIRQECLAINEAVRRAGDWAFINAVQFWPEDDPD
jgi:hypothetical protein